MDFHFQPVPHDEAIALISKMPAVSRQVYDELIPELKALTFTVKGVALAKDREAIRDLLATEPGGANWDDAKRKVIAVLKANDFNDKAAERRAEFLLRHWTGIAYSAAHYRLAVRNVDTHPWWQYLSMGDTRVRATHGVLNRKIIRYDSPFWETHLPPWEPMCRCTWRAMNDFELEEIIKEDADKPVEQRRFLEGAILKKLETDNSLMGAVNLVTYNEGGLPEKSVWTPMMPHDLRTPAQKGQGWTGWNPRNIVPSKADLAKMLKLESVKEVMDFAKTKEVAGATVAEWIEGKPQAAREKKAPVVPKAAPEKPSKPQARITLSEAMKAGRMQPENPLTWDRAGRVLDALRQPSPLTHADKLKGITGAPGGIQSAVLTKAADDFLSFLPPSLAAGLPKFDIAREAAGTAPEISGLWRPDKKIAELYFDHPDLKTETGVRRVLFHELAHWLSNLSGAEVDDWKSQIAAHFKSRTAGDAPVEKDGVLYLPDKWYELYAGKADGAELLPVYMELLSSEDAFLSALHLARHHKFMTEFLQTFDLITTLFRAYR